jgi:hypothetical protein
MTLNMLHKRIALVATGLGSLIAVEAILKLAGNDEVYATIKDLSPLVIAILAAYLASCFQQRANFVQSLQSLWSQLIDAKNDLIEYTRIPSPTREQYEQVYKQISKAIDEMRGVYRNTGESDEYKGYFPYEPLHDMRKSLETLRPDSHRADSAEAAEQAVLTGWNALRLPFLAEFSPPEPTAPIVEEWSVDERLDGPAPTQRRHSWRSRS